MLMYKTIFFVKNTGDEQIIQVINKRMIPLMQKIFKQEIPVGKIESNLLDDRKFEYYFEISCNSKTEFDMMMNSNEGKSINKELSGIHNDILIYSIQF